MNRFIFLLQFLILFVTQTVAQNNWLTLPTAPQSWRLDDCYFICPDTGWAINGNYSWINNTPTEFGQICGTTDGGNTWQVLKDSSLTFFRAIGFADSQTGWVGNLAYSPYTPDTIPIYQTFDGGLTWAPVPNIPNPRPAGICGISVASDSVIYAYGRYDGPPVLIKTIDKGNTWASTDMSPYATGLVDGYFFSKDTGFISGNNGWAPTILSTYDGGFTWQTRYISTSLIGNVWKLSFPSRNIGYGTIEMGGVPYFIKTIDGGLTWSEKPFLSTAYDEEGIGFINDSVGWIGGNTAAGNYKTTDGGNTWNLDASFGTSFPPYFTMAAINRFRRFGDTLMYASGNTIYKLNYDPSGITILYPTVSSFNNFPNPFENETIINYDLPFDCKNVIMNIYNMEGQKLFSQNIGSQNKGPQQIPFSANFPQGIYYCSIATDKFQWTKKMVIIK